jgi:hypothetical protein
VNPTPLVPTETHTFPSKNTALHVTPHFGLRSKQNLKAKLLVERLLHRKKMQVLQACRMAVGTWWSAVRANCRFERFKAFDRSSFVRCRVDVRRELYRYGEWYGSRIGGRWWSERSCMQEVSTNLPLSTRLPQIQPPYYCCESEEKIGTQV